MKYKKNLVVLIISIIIIILIVGGISAYLILKTDIFKSPQESFLKYFMQNKELMNIIENSNDTKQNEYKKQNSYISNGNLIISLQEDDGSSQNMNFEILTNNDNQNKRKYSEVKLKNEDSDLLKVSYINSEDIYAIKCEDVLQYYIGIKNSNLKETLKNWGIVDQETLKSIPDSITLEEVSNTLPEENIKAFTDKYINLIIQNISKEKYEKNGKQEISSLGENYNCNSYVLNIDGGTIKQILIKIIQELKNDQQILSLLDENSKNQYIESIDNLITDLNEMTIENSIKITVYENKMQLVKTIIELSDSVRFNIDMKNNEKDTQKASITVEIIDPSLQTETGAIKINLSKVITQSNITNTIEIIPDTNVPSANIIIKNTLGNIKDTSIVVNSFSTTVNNSKGETIMLSYDNTIEPTDQIPEIMELKNSNAIILNNYTAEQLIPFLQNTLVKIQEVLNNKIGQLGMNI